MNVSIAVSASVCFVATRKAVTVVCVCVCMCQVWSLLNSSDFLSLLEVKNGTSFKVVYLRCPMWNSTLFSFFSPHSALCSSMEFDLFLWFEVFTFFDTRRPVQHSVGFTFLKSMYFLQDIHIHCSFSPLAVWHKIRLQFSYSISVRVTINISICYTWEWENL